jgi:hypothetical protein
MRSGFFYYSGITRTYEMNKKVLLAILVIVFSILACGGGNSSDTGGSVVKPQETKRGWLCDFDRTGSIRLWNSASMQAIVKDTVGTCVGCCVDVTMMDETSVEGILFYKISVGGQSGWVDVEYFYWNKPSWSTN